MAYRNWKQLAYPFLRIAYRRYVGWLKLMGRSRQSAAVAVWHDGKVLKVRHSYRRGWRLPGGVVQQGEDPRRAACRELHEEVGLAIEPHDLTLIKNEQSGSRKYFIYKCQLADNPQIKIDNWEIVEAKFVSPG